MQAGQQLNNALKYISIHHCQTLENKSSLPPNPPTGFAKPPPVVVVVVVVVWPELLVQPPNSSSAATVGAVVNPDPPGTMLCEAKDPEVVPVMLPAQPRFMGCEDALLGRLGLFEPDAGVLQALESHMSDVAHAALVEERVPAAGVVAGDAEVCCVDGAFKDRLNTEEDVEGCVIRGSGISGGRVVV
jgi:hypothetical protein